jgi:hypothetical protein
VNETIALEPLLVTTGDDGLDGRPGLPNPTECDAERSPNV